MKIPGVPDMGPRSAGGISGAGGRNVNPAYKGPSTAEKGLAQARKAIGATKPKDSEVERRLNQDKVREMARIRKQGRNTR
jgi:hypothetical protein